MPLRLRLSFKCGFPFSQQNSLFFQFFVWRGLEFIKIKKSIISLPQNGGKEYFVIPPNKKTLGGGGEGWKRQKGKKGKKVYILSTQQIKISFSLLSSSFPFRNYFISIFSFHKKGEKDRRKKEKVRGKSRGTSLRSSIHTRTQKIHIPTHTRTKQRMKTISGIAPLLLLLLLLLGYGQYAVAKGDILYRNICLCGYRGWERRYFANVTNPPLVARPPDTPSPLIPQTPPPPPPPPNVPDPITGLRKPAPDPPPPEVVPDPDNRTLVTVYEDLILAYYLKMTFYHRHLQTNFTYTRECAPGATCHDYSRTSKRCAKFPLLPKEHDKTTWHRHHYHKLCYQVRNIPKWDRYWFDRHKREAKVVNGPYETESQPIITDDIQRECGGECKARFGMEVIGGKMRWRSTVDKITDEADMCAECA